MSTEKVNLSITSSTENLRIPNLHCVERLRKSMTMKTIVVLPISHLKEEQSEILILKECPETHMISE